MAMAFLTSKKQWQPQSLWSAISELNQVIARPERRNLFYQIIARYFEKFRDIAPVEVGNVIRMEIAKYLLENQNWIQVSKFEVQNSSQLYIAFLFFCEVSTIFTISVSYLMCTLFITALDKPLFGCSRSINIHIHAQSSETDNRQDQHRWNTNGGAGAYASAEHYSCAHGRVLEYRCEYGNTHCHCLYRTTSQVILSYPSR